MPNVTELESNDGKLPLLQFYVYVLMDPRDSNVFYVGKGQGQRALDHVAEVRHLLASGVALTSEKHLRIQDILDDGDKPKALVVARFKTDNEAHAVEAVLINLVYGYESLTNAARGHGAEFVRPRGDLEEIHGLDIPQSVRTRDGTFRNLKLEGLRAAGAYELRERIRQELSNLGFTLRDFALGVQDRPFDPGESNGSLGLIVAIQGIDFIVSFSAKCRPGVSIANTPATRNSKAYDGLARIEAVMGAEFHAGKPKNNKVEGEGRYRDFGRLHPSSEFERIKPTFDPDNLEPLFELMGEFRTILGPTPAGHGAVG